MTHRSPKRNMVPKAVLMRSGLVSRTTVEPVNTAQPKTIVNSARPMRNVFNKAHATVSRPKAVVNAAWPKAVLNAVKRNQVNAVRASACWDWKPKTKGNPQQDLEEKGVIDSGCSRHITWNMSYLTNFEEIDGGYVAFEGNPKGRKITGIVIAGNQSNGNAGTKACDDAGKSSLDAGFKPSRDNEKKVTEEPRKESNDSSKEDESNDQEKGDYVNNTNNVNTTSRFLERLLLNWLLF
ncbi:hypothetical protein Tco_0236721 [Tanacetum coccineum]